MVSESKLSRVWLRRICSLSSSMRCSRSRKRTTYVAPSSAPVASAAGGVAVVGFGAAAGVVAGVVAAGVVAGVAAGVVAGVAAGVDAAGGVAPAGAAAAGAAAGVADAAGAAFVLTGVAGAAAGGFAEAAGVCARAPDEKMVTAANAARRKLFMSRIGFPRGGRSGVR